MKLFLDIGNQRVKWLTSSQLAILSFEDMENTLATQVISSDADDSFVNTDAILNQVSDSVEDIIISSVAGSTINETLTDSCKRLTGITPKFLVSTESACGVENGYQNPQTLGIDRWCAIVAAAKQVGTGHAALIVDAGTAVTVDYLNRKHQFVGGMIFPGVSTMLNALNRNTGQISVDFEGQSAVSLNRLNDNTDLAVTNGVIHCVVSAVDMAISHHYDIANEKFQTIITGGDAMLINNHSEFQMHYIPELVLTGAQALAEELYL